VFALAIVTPTHHNPRVVERKQLIVIDAFFFPFISASTLPTETMIGEMTKKRTKRTKRNGKKLVKSRETKREAEASGDAKV
jgi:hypothetical protein